jgi:hypothetical protein
MSFIRTIGGLIFKFIKQNDAHLMILFDARKMLARNDIALKVTMGLCVSPVIFMDSNRTNIFLDQAAILVKPA